MSIKGGLIRALYFDRQQQDLYLTILASQLKSGRSTTEIFRSFRKSSNHVYRLLAKRSLDPNSTYFASDYGDFFPAKTATLLNLAQRFNALPQFIDEMVKENRQRLSLFDSVVLKNAMELALAVLFTVLSALLYLFNDSLLARQVDLSGSFFFKFGSLIVAALPLLLAFVLPALGVYLVCRNLYVPLRHSLKALGCYRYRDIDFAIELFQTIRIMTSSDLGREGSIFSLLDELSRVYGDTPLRQKQFSILRLELSKGSLLQDAIRRSRLLGEEELDIFAGLTPNESTQQIGNASAAICNLMADRSRAELRFFSRNLQFALLLYLAVAMVAVLDASMGGGGVSFDAIA